MKMIITSPPTTPTNTVAGTDAAAGPEYMREETIIQSVNQQILSFLELYRH